MHDSHFQFIAGPPMAPIIGAEVTFTLRGGFSPTVGGLGQRRLRRFLDETEELARKRFTPASPPKLNTQHAPVHAPRSGWARDRTGRVTLFLSARIKVDVGHDPVSIH
jgi:hypothetical protein